MTAAPNPTPDLDTLIIGAGISGLAAAWRLRKAGKRVLLLEGSDRAGGCVRTVSEQGHLFETGPNTFPGSADALIELAMELGLRDDIVAADPAAARRYIFLDGRLEALPDGLLSFLKTPLIGWRTRLRLLSDLFTAPQPPNERETFADFVRRKAGQDALDNVAGPFVSGVYAGDPEQLSLHAAFPTLAAVDAEYGSLLRGMKKHRKARPTKPTGLNRRTLYSFRRGMQQLTDTLAASLGDDLKLRHRVDSIERKKNMWTVAGRRGDLPFSHQARALILAVPGPQAAALLEATDPGLASDLRSVLLAGVCSVYTAYPKEAVLRPLDGFGHLIPRRESIRLLGTVWSSSLFAGRCPQDHVSLTSFIGGVFDQGIADEEEIAVLNEVRRGLRQTLGIDVEPTYSKVTRHPFTLPQYTLGQLERSRKIQAALRALPGLDIVGSHLHGVSLDQCVRAGLAVAP